MTEPSNDSLKTLFLRKTLELATLASAVGVLIYFSRKR